MLAGRGRRRSRRGRRPRRRPSRSSAEERPAAEVDLAADGIDRQADLDALADLGDQRIEERRPDVAGLVAVDQQVDVVLGGGDVLEHPREVPASVEQGIDHRRDRRGERQRQVGRRTRGWATRPAVRAARRLGTDRPGIQRIGRDPALPSSEAGADGRRGGPDREVTPPAHGRAPGRDVERGMAGSLPGCPLEGTDRVLDADGAIL